MVDTGKRRRGRPIKSGARRNYVGIRLSDKELGRVRIISETYDISSNEVLRLALNQYYEKLF